MQRLVLLLATVALLSQIQTPCSAASINKPQLRRLEVEVYEEKGVDGKAAPVKRSFRKFASIKQKPPLTLKHVAGEVLELTCVAIGSPAPSIQWFKNDEPILDNDLDSHEIIDSISTTSIAQLSSTLVVTKPSSRDIDFFTCRATAGRHSDVASVTVLNFDSNTILTDRQRLQPLAPRILTMYEIFVATIGQNVLLQCKAKGHPRPLVEWLDNNGTKIENHSRMKILKTGELFIPKLSWKDMGDFTCQASNVHGTSSKTTFIYPVRETDEKEGKIRKYKKHFF